MVKAPASMGPAGGGGVTNRDNAFPDNPNEQLAFEIAPRDQHWAFTPEFYPDRFTQQKSRELSRNVQQCGGESVSIKAIKNREFHAKGVLLEGEIAVFQKLLDFDGKVDIISPLTPSGGMECHIKQGKLGKQSGWDPHTRQWMFKYTLDFVSTGRDEYERGSNAIVTAITEDKPTGGGGNLEP